MYIYILEKISIIKYLVEIMFDDVINCVISDYDFKILKLKFKQKNGSYSLKYTFIYHIYTHTYVHTLYFFYIHMQHVVNPLFIIPEQNDNKK